MALKRKSYNLGNFKEISQISKLTPEQVFDIEVVGHVFPFKTNNYIVDELIDWDNIPGDPTFVLNFPHRDMLRQPHYEKMASLLRAGAGQDEIKAAADEIRWQLNPHPADQMDKNVPKLDGKSLEGIQHKYRETVLFFPSQGQSCFAYCTFCFRWPQFVDIEELKFASDKVERLIAYLREHKEVTDLLITGGDPLTMRGETLAHYIDCILGADLPHLRTIRFGTKTLTYWPYRFTTDPGAPALLETFRKIVASGRHLAIMTNFNHPVELTTPALREAVSAIRETGAQIRTQSPLLRHINAEPGIWSAMWKEQVRLGMVPYYMFIVRNTGAQHFFGVPLAEAYEIFREAYSNVSGLARTVRGPSMSADPGKILISGVAEVEGRKVFVLTMIQGRKAEWVLKPFFAEYNESALWLDDLVPAFGQKDFLFEKEDAPLWQILCAP